MTIKPIGPQITAPRIESARNLDAHKERIRAYDARRDIAEAAQAFRAKTGRNPIRARLDVQRFTAAEQLKDPAGKVFGLEIVQDDEAEGGLVLE